MPPYYFTMHPGKLNLLNPQIIAEIVWAYLVID